MKKKSTKAALLFVIMSIIIFTSIIVNSESVGLMSESLGSVHQISLCDSIVNQDDEIITHNNISNLESVKITVSKSNADAITGVFIVGFYDINNKLIYVNFKTTTVTEYTEVIKININEDVSSASKIKAYAWSDFENIVSLCHNIEGYPEILESGKCGENLTWALYSDGLLKISGTGRSYDFVKGILIGKNQEQVNQYVQTTGHSAYAFTEGKNYVEYTSSDGTYIGFVSPWYRYRPEVFKEGALGNSYCTKAEYDKWNPNGWTYNRIEIDSGITYIGDWMFYRICGATELIVPGSVTELGDWAIRFSPSLKHIKLPDSVEKIGIRGCSRNEVATSIELGNGYKNIADYAFAQNSMVKYLKVSGDVESIGEMLFEGDSSLEHVVFEGITELKKNTLAVCASLKRVDLPETLKTIGYGVFMRTGLENITIPANVNSIDTNAFYLCENLKSVYIDSPTIAAGLKYSTSYGRLISYAEHIYIKDGIEVVGDYLINSCTKGEQINGYTLYTVNK